jgi:UDP-N-acetylmuramyl pentapeptide synthase
VTATTPLLRTLKTAGRVVTYGLSPDNDIYAEAVAAEGLGEAALGGGPRRKARNPCAVAGAHMVLNAAGGHSAGRALGLGWAAIANA